jgi:hypothetical protein
MVCVPTETAAPVLHVEGEVVVVVGVVGLVLPPPPHERSSKAAAPAMNKCRK